MKKLLYVLSFIIDMALTPIICIIFYVMVIAQMLYSIVVCKGGLIKTVINYNVHYSRFIINNAIYGLKVHKERILGV